MLVCGICYRLLEKFQKNIITGGLGVLFHRKRNFSSLPSLYPCISGKEVNPGNQYDCLADAVTPLWQVPYEEQLNIKRNWTAKVVENIASKIKREKSNQSARFGYPTIADIKPSPVTEGYRNKDELNIRNGIDGNPKTVGFLIGSPADGPVVCVPGTYLLTGKQKHKDIAEAFQIFLRQSSLPACHDFHDGGYWRRLVIRSTECGQTMAVAVTHPRDLTQEQLKEQQDLLREFFLTGEGKHCTPDSLYFQACRNTRCTHQQAPYVLLHGVEHLTEYLHGLAFRISPDSFFQVNTKGAEVLYSTMLDLAHPTSITTLLDLCSGTGTISLLASRQVRGCVGIEAIEDAVNDARYNAKINNIHNVDFFVGRAEKRLRKILADLDMAPDIVAVVNPSRQGVAPKVITLLVECPQIRRVVYISCKADHPGVMSNFAQLCIAGRFSLRKVVPVDMFPHTLHTEVVFEFRR